MKKIIVLVLTILTCAFLFKVSFAQDTEPPLGLPSAIIEEDTDSSTAITTYTSATATRTATKTTTTQEAVDDAEVGSEIVMLIILSVVGGLGIFLIKKYFDLKRYQL
jgi:hypothetical protein